MINIFPYPLHEGSHWIPGRTGIREILWSTELSPEKASRIIGWWDKHRGDIEIHLLPFVSASPIIGCFVDENQVALNSKQMDRIPPEMVPFILLHESRHSDQAREGLYHEEYFRAALEEDRDAFAENYRKAEADANTYALSVMDELGFSIFARVERSRLRANEDAAGQVYEMMREDIKKYHPATFRDLVMKQIIG